MEFLKAFLNLPDEDAMALWQDKGNLLSEETRNSNLNKAMDRFHHMMNDWQFISMYQTLSADQQSLIPLMMIASEDIKCISTKLIQQRGIMEPDYELDMAS